MCLLHMQQSKCVKEIHCRKGREYSLRELHHFSVDGYCPETRTI